MIFSDTILDPVILCLVYYFLLNRCCTPFLVHYTNMQEKVFAKKSLNVSNVKLFSNSFFKHFWIFGFLNFFMPFCIRTFAIKINMYGAVHKLCRLKIPPS